MTNIKKLMIVLIAALGVLAFAMAVLLLLVDRGVVESPDLDIRVEKDSDEHGKETDGTVSVYEVKEEDLKLLEKYKEYNKDVVGLIRINDTVLNHPIVHTPEDEEYYLYKDLDKKYNSHGVPFLSAQSQMEQKEGNMIVYGHNIKIRTRDVFADLAYYEDLEFYKEHPIIETVSKSGTRKWLIFCYFITDNSDKDPFRYSDYTSFLSMKEQEEYFSKVQERNWLNVPVEIGMEDTCIMLSSCSNELAGSGTNRMVVMAKLINSNADYRAIVDAAVMAEDPLLPEKLR